MSTLLRSAAVGPPGAPSAIRCTTRETRGTWWLGREWTVLALLAAANHCQEERRLDDVDAGDDEGDHEWQCVSQRPAECNGQGCQRQERQPDPTQHRDQVAATADPALHPRHRTAKQEQRDD